MGKEYEYKEDSTRGLSKIKPKNYKGDAYVQSWLDSRKLATLSKWLDESSDYGTRFMSDIVKSVIDMVVEHLVNIGEVEMVEFTEDARDMLTRKYRVNLNPCGRGEKNVLHNMILDDKKRGVQISESITAHPASVESNLSRPIDNVTAEQIMEKMKEVDNKRIREQAKKELEKAKEGLEFDENGVIVPSKEKISGIVYEEDMKEFEKREENREKIEELDKEICRLKKKEEKLLETTDDEEIEGGE